MMKPASLQIRAIVALIMCLAASAALATKRADFALTPVTPSISGEVRDQTTGNPLPNLVVYALKAADLDNATEATTDDQGRYTLASLPAGNYYVATPGGSGSALPGTQVFAGEYHPGTLDRAAATVISLATGESRTGVDFTLDPGRSISGRVQGQGQDQVGDTASPFIGLVTAVPTQADDPDFARWLLDSYSAFIDSDGSYTVSGLPPTDYYVYTDTFGTPYADEIYANSYAVADAQAVDVTGGDAAGIDFLLDLGAVVEGRVTGADSGAALEGVTVGFARQDTLDSGIAFIASYAYLEGRTNSNGEYRVLGLPPGTYLGRLDLGESPVPQYANELYPGVYEAVQATSITLTPGEDRSGIDFDAEIGGIVTGQVQRADNGQPLEGISIYAAGDRVLEIEDLVGRLGFRETLTDANGQYRLEGLPPFDYLVLAMPEVDYDPQSSSTPSANQYFSGQFHGGVYRSADATAIPVALESTTNGIDFALPVGDVLSGLVTRDDTGDPLSDVEIVTRYTDLPTIDVDALYEQYFLDYLLASTANTETGDDGTYEIIGLRPGPVAVGAFSIGFLPEYYADRQDPTLADTIQLELGGIATGSISGQVTDVADGRPLAGLQVSLYDSGSNDVVDTTTTDASGNYSIGLLPPGTYKAMVDGGDLYRSAFYDNASDLATADGIAITEGGDVVAIDFSLLAVNEAAAPELLMPILNFLLIGD